MSTLLISEPPLQVLPSLAVAVGLNEAIVLQQIHYWLGRSTNEINGFRWVYNTVNQWREQFPFWSDDTISRALTSLRKSGVVIAEKLSKNSFDKTLFYRIDYTKLPSSIPATCGNRESQDAGISIQRLPKTTQQKSPPTPKGECVANAFGEFWKAYPKKVGKDAAESAWKRKVRTLETVEAIRSALVTKTSSEDWTKEEGKYVPNPATWLNQGRWKDEEGDSAAADPFRGAL